MILNAGHGTSLWRSSEGYWGTGINERFGVSTQLRLSTNQSSRVFGIHYIKQMMCFCHPGLVVILDLNRGFKLVFRNQNEKPQNESSKTSRS